MEVVCFYSLSLFLFTFVKSLFKCVTACDFWLSNSRVSPQTNHENKCCHCMFLWVLVVKFIFWFCCGKSLLWFWHWNLLVRVKKRLCPGLIYLTLLPQTWLENHLTSWLEYLILPVKMKRSQNMVLCLAAIWLWVSDHHYPVLLLKKKSAHIYVI